MASDFEVPRNHLAYLDLARDPQAKFSLHISFQADAHFQRNVNAQNPVPAFVARASISDSLVGEQFHPAISALTELFVENVPYLWAERGVSWGPVQFPVLASIVSEEEMWDAYPWPQLSAEEDERLGTLLSGDTPDSLPRLGSPTTGPHTDHTSHPQASQMASSADHNELLNVSQATASVANIEPENAGHDVPGPTDSAVTFTNDVDSQEHASMGDAVNWATPSSSSSSFIYSPPPYTAQLSEDDGPDVPCVVEGHTIIPVYPPKDGSRAYLKVNGITQGYFEGGEYYEVDED